MNTDRLIRRKKIFNYIEIKDTKLKELIDNNLFVKPISVSGFNEKLFSFNELQEWIEAQKAKRHGNNQGKE